MEYLKIINYFDYLIFGLLLFFNIRYWNRIWTNEIGCAVFIVLTILFPMFSIGIEFELKKEENQVCFDAFTMLYTFFKFPLYWILFVLHFIVQIFKPYINKTCKTHNP